MELLAAAAIGASFVYFSDKLKSKLFEEAERCSEKRSGCNKNTGKSNT